MGKLRDTTPPAVFTLISSLQATALRYPAPYLYARGSFGSSNFSAYTSTMSGSLTVWLQPRYSLWPMVGNGDPKNEAPDMSHPSLLWTWPSYHWPGPKKGWCGFMNKRACPSALLAGMIAHMLDPTWAAASRGFTVVRI